MTVMLAMRALASGAGQVVRAPLTFASVVLLTAITALPFAVVMGGRLQSALNDQPPVMLGSEEIDADWWLEFRRHAEGLEATFTPAIIGFAAPLSVLSAVLDGQAPSAPLLVPLGLAVVAWAFIWGMAIARFREHGERRPGALVAAGGRTWARFVAISVVAMAAQLVLYLTVHAVLFGPVYEALTGTMARERDAFLVRVALYLVFGAGLAVVSMAADYSRIALALRPSASIVEAGRAGTAFIVRWWRPVAVVFLVPTVVMGVLYLLYGVGEAYGGSRVAGWRGVAIGQTFVFTRLAMRLVVMASEVRLFERIAASLGRA
jgi:hypothetical protein